jgi:hypothetical protein
MTLSKDLQKSLSPALIIQERVVMPDGLLSMSDQVFLCALQRLQLEAETIIELMAQPVEDREKLLKFYEEEIP